MTGTSECSNLIDLIYRCATDRARWPETLDAIRQHLNFDWIAVVGCGPEPAMFRRYYDTLGNEDHWREYDQYYKYIDPVSRYIKQNPDREIFYDRMVKERDELASSEFEAWAARHNSRHILGTAIMRLSNGTQIYLGFHRAAEKGHATSGEIAALKTLAPHLGRTFRTSHATACGRPALPVLDAVVESYVAGIAFLSLEGTIARTNKAFDEILKSHQCLSLDSRRLRIADVAVQQELERKLYIAFQSRRRGETLHKDQILFRTPKDDIFVGVYIHPLPLRPAFEFCTEDAVILYLHSSMNYSPTATERFAAHFRLTATERKVLESLLKGYFLEEHAERHDISIGTVRWHMQNILQKTRTRNQTQLVRAVSSMLFYRY